MFARNGSIAVALLVLFAGCGGGGGGNGGNSYDLLLQVLKGKVDLADLAVYEMHDTGAHGRMVGSGQTDADGNATVNLAGVKSRYVLAVGWGGVIDDPFSGQQTTIPANFPLCAVIDLNGDLGLRYQLNPLTTLVSKRTEEMAREADITLEDAYLNADLNFRNKFMLTQMIGTTTGRDLTQPQTATDDGTEIGVFTAALCEYAVMNVRNPFELIWLLGTDARDGQLDAHYNETPIKWTIGGDLDADVWSIGLSGAYESFRDSGLNVNGYTDNDTNVDDALIQAKNLANVPSFTRLWPRYVEAGGQTTIDVNGNDLPDVTDVRIRVGGFTVDSGDISDNGNGGYSVQLGSSFTDQLDLTFGVRYDFEVSDTVTGQFKVDRSAIGLVLPDREPVINADVGYPYVDAYGGGALKVHGLNFKPTTAFTIGGLNAEVVWLSPPNAATLVIPQLAEGNHDLQASDAGGQSTVPNAITAMNKGASTAEAGQDLRPVLAFGARYQFGDDTVTTFHARLNYDNAGDGTYTLNGEEISESNPTPTPVVDSGQVYTADLGLQWETLLDGGENIFMRGDWNGDVGAALGPNTQIGLIKEPAGDVSAQTAAGTFNTVMLRWNFDTGETQQLTGTIELREDGSGSLNVKNRTMLGTFETEEPLAAGFTYQLGVRGAYTITSSALGADFEIEGQTDAAGNVHFFCGEDDNWLMWGVAGRMTGAWDAVEAAGAYIGPRSRLQPSLAPLNAVSGNVVEYGRINMALEPEAGSLSGVRFDEGVEAGDASPNGEFRWKTHYGVKVPTAGGRYTNGAGEPRGFWSAVGQLLVGAPDKGSLGLNLYVSKPQIKTGRTVSGRLQYVGLKGSFYGDAALSGGVDNWSLTGQVRYQADVGLTATYIPQSNETKHTRRLGDGTTQFAVYDDEDWGIYASLQLVGVGDKLFRYATESTDDTTSPYFGQEAPFLQGVGATNWGVTTWTNSGAPGIQYVSIEAEKPAEPATAVPDGSWYTGTIGSDLTGGAYAFNAGKLEWSYSGGSGTITGHDRAELENGTFSTGVVTGTSQVSGFDADGFFTETDSGGTTWRGFLFNGGKASWKVSVGADLTQDLAIGTLETTAAPDTCDRAGFRMIQGFDMPNASFVTILPITNMYTVPNAQRGVGSFFYYPYDASHSIPFVYFSDNLGQVDATGGFAFTDQSGPWYGGIHEGSGASELAPGGEGEAPTRIALQFQLNF